MWQSVTLPSPFEKSWLRPCEVFQLGTPRVHFAVKQHCVALTLKTYHCGNSDTGSDKRKAPYKGVESPRVHFAVKQHCVALTLKTYHCGNSDTGSDKRKAPCKGVSHKLSKESLTKDKFLKVLHGKGRKKKQGQSYSSSIKGATSSFVYFEKNS